MVTQRNKVNEQERFYLWWHCPQTQNRDMAGVAYYNEGDGDYRLIINFFPDNDYFLKCIGGANDQYRYRLVAVKKRDGKAGRFYQGDGIFNKATNEIVIQAAPFSKFLVMSLKQNKENKN
jgi:hypothetical protein